MIIYLTYAIISIQFGGDILNTLEQYCDKIGSYIEIDGHYIYLFLLTVIVFVVATIIKKIGIKLIMLIDNNSKEYSYMNRFKLVIGILKWFLIFFIWENYIESIITLVSFVSAAIAFSLRDIILNFFSGIYIKLKKPFEVEDRIEIGDLKGDVVNITTMNFEVLEVNDKEHGGQSSGIIITFPNSTVFHSPIKNYNKAFKYIWDEITVKVPIDCDLVNTKKELYRIVNNNQIIKTIPNKMKNQINEVGPDYRIYYNKFEPIIYTQVIDDHIELQIRFLIHPKKMRYVESQLWNKILVAQNEKKLELYKE